MNRTITLNDKSTVSLTDEQFSQLVDQVDKDGFFTLKSANGLIKNLISFNGSEYVEAKELWDISSQEERVASAESIVWTPYNDTTMPADKVSLKAAFNHSEFTLGKAESGNFVVFCKTKGKLNRNVQMEGKLLSSVIIEASALAISESLN